jgi:MazG family protein
VTAGAELEKLLSIMAELRGPDGCPWDREQTMASLRPFVLEEAHELVDAIQSGESQAICEELGDLLLEVVFVTQIASEAGTFTMVEVARGIREKLVRRHPHVFTADRAGNAGEALGHWEAMKAREKPKGESLLDGVPRSLPALSRAAKLSKRAANAGFDWDSIEQIRRKVEEELDEVDAARKSQRAEDVHEEIGDLLFAIVNLARHAHTDAELALSDANEKFSRRFRHIETELASRGRTVEETSMEELERLWLRAKERVAKAPRRKNAK